VYNVTNNSPDVKLKQQTPTITLSYSALDKNNKKITDMIAKNNELFLRQHLKFTAFAQLSTICYNFSEAIANQFRQRCKILLNIDVKITNQLIFVYDLFTS
jgi:hypothetical protein